MFYQGGEKLIVASLIFTFFLSLYLFFYYANFFQKQYYNLSRFLKLVQEKFHFHFTRFVWFVLFITITFLPHFFQGMIWIKWILILPLSWLVYYRKINDKIIPFKITKRIKRMIIQYSISYALFAFILLLLKTKAEWIPLLYRLCFGIFFILTCLINQGFEKILQWHYKKKAKRKLQKCLNLKTIGITGSFGKSSTKFYTKQILEQSYSICCSPKSYNTLNGLLITINQQLHLSHQILLLELGIDQVKGMNKYIRFFDFDIACVTSIGMQHLSTFKTIENIESEKIKLLQHLKPYQTAIINLDDPRIVAHLDEIQAQKITISSTKKADIYATDIQIKATGTSFTLHLFNQIYPLKIRILGRHHMNDLLMAIAIAKVLQMEDEKILKRLKTIKNLEHRLELKKEGLWQIIDDSYNSNFNGFKEALAVLKTASTKKILITPGLIELNDLNHEINQKLASEIKKSCDFVALIGANSFSIYKQLIQEKYPKKNIEQFRTYLEAWSYLKNNFIDQKITILIENDLPDTYLK